MKELSWQAYLSQMGLTNLSAGNVVMWLIGLGLIYLAIKKSGCREFSGFPAIVVHEQAFRAGPNGAALSSVL